MMTLPDNLRDFYVKERKNLKQIDPVIQRIVPYFDDDTHHFEFLSRFYATDDKEVPAYRVFDKEQDPAKLLALDKFILSQAIETVSEFRQHNPGLRFQASVNVSEGSIIQYADFINYAAVRIKAENRRTGGELENALFRFEVGESSWKSTAPFIESASQEGFGISIDDLGTAHSSFGKLKREAIPAVADLSQLHVKLDRSYITDLLKPGHEYASSDPVFVKTIIALKDDKPGIRVVAEGIETEELDRYLRDEGVDFGQGYFYSRPIPPAEFEERFLQPKLYKQPVVRETR